MSLPGIKPGTLSVLDSRDNHYTIKTVDITRKSKIHACNAQNTVRVGSWWLVGGGGEP